MQALPDVSLRHANLRLAFAYQCPSIVFVNSCSWKGKAPDTTSWRKARLLCHAFKTAWLVLNNCMLRIAQCSITAWASQNAWC